MRLFVEGKIQFAVAPHHSGWLARARVSFSQIALGVWVKSLIFILSIIISAGDVSSQTYLSAVQSVRAALAQMFPRLLQLETNFSPAAAAIAVHTVK
jgi:hypothetical protein